MVLGREAYDQVREVAKQKHESLTEFLNRAARKEAERLASVYSNQEIHEMPLCKPPIRGRHVNIYLAGETIAQLEKIGISGENTSKFLNRSVMLELLHPPQIMKPLEVS